MEHEHHQKNSKFSGWTFSLLGLGLNGLIVIINLVASSGYTSKADHQQLQKDFDNYKLQQASELSGIREKELQKLGDIAVSINDLNGKMKDNGRQDEELKDHEERIRAFDKFRK